MQIPENMALAVNESLRQVARARANYLAESGLGSDPKHNKLYKEFGLKTNLTFRDYFNLYDRQGFAFGAVKQLTDKCWEKSPYLVEGDNEDEKNTEQTQTEKEFKLFAKRLKLWGHLAEADKRRLVGEYSAVIIQIADDKEWKEPAENVKPDDVVGLIPVWQECLTVNNWDQDTLSANYGRPLSYAYHEYDFDSSTSGNTKPRRSVTIDASRVFVFGDLYDGRSLLTAGFNDAVTLEKLIHSGGEGAYKNAASHLHMNFGEKADLGSIAKMYEVELSELSDIFNDMVKSLNSSFDTALITQQADAKVLSVDLPRLKEPFDNALQSFSASVQIPATIIAGHQTGERASGEDNDTMARRCMSRQEKELTPDIESLVLHLQSFGCFVGTIFSVVWDSLLEPSPKDKLEMADKMATVNQKLIATGEVAFTNSEIRVAGGYEAEADDDLSVEVKKLENEGEGADASSTNRTKQ